MCGSGIKKVGFRILLYQCGRLEVTSRLPSSIFPTRFVSERINSHSAAQLPCLIGPEPLHYSYPEPLNHKDAQILKP